MEKKKVKIIAIIFLIIFGVTLFFLLKDKENDALKFKVEYEKLNANEGTVKLDIPEDNPIIYLNTYKELNKKIQNKDSFILYLGFPNCPWCRNIVPVLFDAVKENNIDKIYYINPRVLKEENADDFDSLFNLLYDYLLADEEGNKGLYVPDVYFFKDGKIIGNHLDTVESQTDPRVTLNEEQVNELKGIYGELISKIK